MVLKGPSGKGSLQFEFARADLEPSQTQTMLIHQRSIELTTFSDAFLASIPSFTPLLLRSKSRGTVILLDIIKRLNERHSMQADTAVYLHTKAGPFYRKAFDGVLKMEEEEKINFIYKKLPPKQYFVQNLSMKAAQIPIEFKLNGPWLSFTSQPFGFQHAWEQASNDLRGGIVSSALVCASFCLDEPTEISPYFDYSDSLVEACAAFYIESKSDLANRPSFKIGKYGSLTGVMEN
jgi:hypothetical protein